MEGDQLRFEIGDQGNLHGKVTSEQRAKGNEGNSCADIPGRGNSKCLSAWLELRKGWGKH